MLEIKGNRRQRHSIDGDIALGFFRFLVELVVFGDHAMLTARHGVVQLFTSEREGRKAIGLLSVSSLINTKRFEDAGRAALLDVDGLQHHPIDQILSINQLIVGRINSDTVTLVIRTQQPVLQLQSQIDALASTTPSRLGGRNWFHISLDRKLSFFSTDDALGNVVNEFLKYLKDLHFEFFQAALGD